MKVTNMVKQIPMKHLAFFSLLCSSAASAAERPNIIYIFTDQQTASAMSCAGNPDLHTPNLDRLAAAGVMFNNAYCTAPLSGPSRGAMFTGHYPDAVGLSVNGSPIPDSLRTQTLGTLIKNAGYDCAYGGKWHLPLLDVPDKEYGFDNIYKHSDDGLAEACAEYLSRKHKKPFFLVDLMTIHTISANTHGAKTSLMEISIRLIYGTAREYLPISPRILTMPMSLKAKGQTIIMYIRLPVLLPKTGVCTVIPIIVW